MKKVKIIIIILAALAVSILALALVLMLYFVANNNVKRSVTQYTPTQITESEDKNAKMSSILEYTVDDVIPELSVKKRILLSELGVKADDADSAEKNTDIIGKAINNAVAGTEIMLPEGKVFITEGFKLRGKKDLRIVGNDTILVNTGYSPQKLGVISGNASVIFNIGNCKNIHLEGFTVDYAEPSSAEGTITEIRGGKVYFELFGKPSEEYKGSIVGGETVFSVLVANDKGFYNEIWPQEGTKLSKEDGELRFSVPVNIGKVGDKICCRVSCGSYASPAVFVQNTSGLELRDIGCFSCPSAFFYATCGSSNFVFSGLDISVPDESRAMLASNEDCIHINQLSGKLLIENSNFVGIGDDALNILTMLGVVANVDGNKATVNAGGTQNAFAQGEFLTGETVEFFDSSCNSIGFAKVKKHSGKTIEFDALPEGLKKGCYIQNVSASPDVLVKNCTIGYGRARGVLLQAKNSVVTGCTFKDLRLSAVLAAPDFTYWYEAGFADNLLVKGNTFINCTNTVKDSGFGVVNVTSSHDEVQNKAWLKGHKNVTVMENTFENCSSKPVVITCTENAKIINN